MFGWKRRYDEWEARLGSLEDRLKAMTLFLEKERGQWQSSITCALEEVQTRLEASPEKRVQYLLNSVGHDLSEALKRGLADAQAASSLKEQLLQLHLDLQQRLRSGAAQQPREMARLNQVYHSPFTGYVALFFTGGYTDRVQLLMGPTNPPEFCVCRLNCQGDVNSYAGGIVRQGEYWLAQSQIGEESGVECCYTPFF
jgi:hypothetical protein